MTINPLKPSVYQAKKFIHKLINHLPWPLYRVCFFCLFSFLFWDFLWTPLLFLGFSLGIKCVNFCFAIHTYFFLLYFFFFFFLPVCLALPVCCARRVGFFLLYWDTNIVGACCDILFPFNYICCFNTIYSTDYWYKYKLIEVRKIRKVFKE